MQTRISQSTVWLLTIFAGMLLLPLTGFGQLKLITTTDAREEVLIQADELLNARDDTFSIRVADVKSPFEKEVIPAADPTEAPKVARVDDKPAPEPEPEPARLSDGYALRVISNTIRPKGVFVKGDNRILLLENGKTMRLGQEFVARIRGEEYRVSIANITDETFTLQVGEETLKRPVRVKRIKGIKFDGN